MVSYLLSYLMCCKKVDTRDHGTVDAEAMFKTEMDQVMSLPDPMASVEAYLPANLSGLTPTNNSPDRFSFMQSAKKEKVMPIFPLLNSLSIAILFLLPTVFSLPKLFYQHPLCCDDGKTTLKLYDASLLTSTIKMEPKVKTPALH